MSKEKVQEILSHVDMTKIDLTSFHISEKKFNEMAHLFRNRIVINSLCIVLEKDNYEPKQVEAAFKTLRKVVSDPSCYDYENVYREAQKAVNSVIHDMELRVNVKVNSIKNNTIEKQIKSYYKGMRELIEHSLNLNGTFEDEFDEEKVEKYMGIARSAIEDGVDRIRQQYEVKITYPQEDDSPQDCSESDIVSSEQTEPAESVATAVEPVPSGKSPKKVSFWKRMFDFAH